MDSILFWNQVALNAAQVDFSTLDPAAKLEPQQGGPTRTSRALAIIHLALYDAYAGVRSGATYLQYEACEKPTTNDLSVAQIAAATAASLTLIALFSKQKNVFLNKHQEFVALLSGDESKVRAGLVWGETVASKMLAAREKDGSEASDNAYVPSPLPGKHRLDPTDLNQGFLGPLWGKVKPFGINDLNQKVPGTPPPLLDSAQYATDFNEVFEKGRDQGSTRTPEQTTIGLFWGYDGARNIGVPPRLYNQVVRAIAIKHGATEEQNAKLFAMVNVAMADAGIQAWHEKYLYNVWRPVVGIREANEGWGVTGKGDGNPNTCGDPYWTPLGAPKTNQPAVTPTTPNFPAYPSGHATFGTAALHITQLFLGLPNDFEFEFVSDELNGESIGAGGSVRTRFNAKLTIPRAIEENVLSRVYLGVHWQFDSREGERNGRIIAEMICSSFPAMVPAMA
ncbi:MAG: vanadium-dependent haloperoxidase [Leptolyngbyaceae cyanobacterium CSU_1_4]|nr:vanadium-dependent haloperoxidase [Leptolyngbyaceae cyanobacterium CSU_1_4]